MYEFPSPATPVAKSLTPKMGPPISSHPSKIFPAVPSEDGSKNAAESSIESIPGKEFGSRHVTPPCSWFAWAKESQQTKGDLLHGSEKNHHKVILSLPLLTASYREQSESKVTDSLPLSGHLCQWSAKDKPLVDITPPFSAFKWRV